MAQSVQTKALLSLPSLSRMVFSITDFSPLRRPSLSEGSSSTASLTTASGGWTFIATLPSSHHESESLVSSTLARKDLTESTLRGEAHQRGTYAGRGILGSFSGVSRKPPYQDQGVSDACRGVP
jgi:hypothetical protein